MFKTSPVPQSLTNECIGAYRRVFCNEILARVAVNDQFADRILWSDESTFHLNGTVNKRNDCEWHNENPHRQRINLMKSQGICVWAAVSSKGIIGPYFFQQNDDDEEIMPQTVTGDRYLEMLQDYFYPKFLQLENNGEIIFQQDGATPHYKNTVRDWLDSRFQNRWIGRGTRLPNSIDWPPRSCDLTPCDFWLWGSIKNKVYKTPPLNLNHLGDKIKSAFEEISVEECERSCRTVIKRALKCIELDGRQVSKDLLK